MASSILKPSNGEAWAAVAVILKECPDAMVLVGKRVMNPRDPWSGDAALPGGHYETSDGDLLNTAIRETMEETGIDLRKVGRVVTVLNVEHPRNMPNLNVLPIVFKVDCNVDVVNTASGEFEYLKWIKLSELPNADKVTVVKGNARKAIILGDMIIWGMTRRILCRLYNMYKGEGNTMRN
ncbi:NUDIX hydrolase [Caldivirga maquilingensis]|uniref:NUDIX hydrolase n=1 Tax=Caldivirga maquilingensis (strain ATCC 700844 / DSM 13496 / JCM 10307 / IC-167) TaxID=397948 RepID=A8MD34_CALMQ|nr:NUDIX domain-containing protein [Caldivirga maquilingensis]ABW01690.1 NUDIX hydrolase [Caldivirga maquilingensis IC-167]